MSALFSQLPFGGGVSIALAPVDLQTAQNTTWAKISNVNKALILLVFAKAGTSGDDLDINLQQATDSSGTGAKALSIKEVFFKRGATAFTATPNTRDKFTRSPSTPENRETAITTYVTDTDRVAATNDFMCAIRISPSDLDGDNGFCYVRGQLSDVGTNAQLGFALWIADDQAYQGVDAPSLLA